MMADSRAVVGRIGAGAHAMAGAGLQHGGLVTRLSSRALTLREILEALPGSQRIRHSYPQGYRAFLDGRPASGTVAALEGFGDRRISALTLGAVRAGMQQYQDLVRSDMHAPGRKEMAGRGPRDGAGAAEQYCRAARGIDRLVFEHQLTNGLRLTALSPPQRPEPARSKALDDDELRAVAKVVLTTSEDPALDVLVWMFLRTLALRPAELCHLTFASVNLSRGAMTIVGKGGTVREMPAHLPVLRAAWQLMSERNPGGSGPFFRTADGRTIVTGRHFDTWATHIHAQLEWTGGLRIGVYPLRHTAGHLIDELTSSETLVGLWLGHKHPDRSRASTVYSHDDNPQANWRDRRLLGAFLWGPLDQWPLLLEWDLLVPYLPLVTDDPLPTAAEMRARRRQHEDDRGHSRQTSANPMFRPSPTSH